MKGLKLPVLLLCVSSILVRPALGVVAFHRGDVNNDGQNTIADATILINFLFLNGPPPTCLETADADGTEEIALTDILFILTHLFLGGAELAPPGGVREPCGIATRQLIVRPLLDCKSYSHCPPLDPGAEFAAVVASFDTLETIAGTGRIRDGGDNGWSATFEGGAATEAELSRPHFAMSDGAGRIYIADKDAHAIRRVDTDGSIHTIAGTNVPGDDGDDPAPATTRRLSSPNGLWVRGDGTLYILDLGNGKVRRVSSDGTMTTLFSVSGGILIGRGLWVHESERLVYLASGNRVLRWRPQVGIETHAEGFVSLGNLMPDSNGNLVVTDRGAHRVYRIEADGTSTVLAGNGDSVRVPLGSDGQPAVETPLAGVRGVWILPDDAFFVATHEGSQVWHVDAMGIARIFVDGNSDDSHTGDGEHFRTPGFKISEVRSIAVDKDGHLLLAESDFGYVRRIRYR